MLALYTFGQFIRPSGDPANDGFHQRNDPALAAVDQAEGMLGRSGYASDPGPQSWGLQVYPRFFKDENAEGWAPSTLSLWRDLESVMAYSYLGLHAEAMALGRNWFQKGAWPPLVLWWTGAQPDWAEAVQRYEYLHDHGASARAFGVKSAFDAAGQPLVTDPARIKELAALNRARLAQAV